MILTVLFIGREKKMGSSEKQHRLLLKTVSLRNRGPGRNVPCGSQISEAQSFTLQ